jgi:hypothetical protein
MVTTPHCTALNIFMFHGIDGVFDCVMCRLEFREASSSMPADSLAVTKARKERSPWR